MKKLSLFGIGLLSLSFTACGSAEISAEISNEAAVPLPSSAAETSSLGVDPTTALYCIDTTPPVVTVTAPSSGTLVGGTTFTVRWRAADLCNDGTAGTIVKQKVRFSCAGSEPFDLVREVDGIVREYSWTVPCRECVGAKVLVRAWDKAGNPSADATGGPFNIVKGASCSPPPPPEPCRFTPPDPGCL